MMNYIQFFQASKWFISLLGMLLIPTMTFAQHVKSLAIDADGNAWIHRSELAVNALAIKVEESNLGKIEIITSNGSYLLSRDEHVLQTGRVVQSNLIVFDKPVYRIEMNGLERGIKVEIFLISLPETIKHKAAVSLRTECGQPEMISQEDWRSGLPEPDYDRIFNTVNNIILHHSATSNTITDFTNLVRSIYTYHTQVNGWSDIGYNYLVAPDGTIYAGRDPGTGMETDEVLGAHFCASNTGTMGICLLGTFMDQPPTTDAIQALTELLVWKMAKDSLPPFATHQHPLNEHLGVLAGHRDGCSTLCPGDAVFQSLGEYRQQSKLKLEACGIYLNLPEVDLSGSLTGLFPNPSHGDYLYYNTKTAPLAVRLIGMDGRLWNCRVEHQGELLTIHVPFPPAVYIFEMITKHGVYRQSVVIN